MARVKGEERKCEVDECRELVPSDPPGRVFCISHWLQVPSALQWAMHEAFQSGQGTNPSVKPTQAWYDAVGAAAETIEKSAKKKHGQRK